MVYPVLEMGRSSPNERKQEERMAVTEIRSAIDMASRQAPVPVLYTSGFRLKISAR